jgi:hypothetical protein
MQPLRHASHLCAQQRAVCHVCHLSAVLIAALGKATGEHSNRIYLHPGSSL